MLCTPCCIAVFCLFSRKRNTIKLHHGYVEGFCEEMHAYFFKAHLRGWPTYLLLWVIVAWSCCPCTEERVQVLWCPTHQTAPYAEWFHKRGTSRHSLVKIMQFEHQSGRGARGRSFPFSRATVSPLFSNLNDKLTHPSSKLYSSHGFVSSLTGYLSPGSTSSLNKSTLPIKHCRITSTRVGKEF